MPETETLEGVVQKVNEGKYGKGLQLRGRDDWINESQYQDEPWPRLDQGTQVKLACSRGKNGKLYVAGEGIEVLSVAAEQENGGIQYDEHRPGSFAYRDKAILFQVCLKEAREYVSTIETAEATVERVGAVAEAWYAVGVTLLARNGGE